MKRKKKTVKAEFERSEDRKLLISKEIDREFGTAPLEVVDSGGLQ
jgi:hypothetical protein